jgi:hypothetical protein
MHRDKWDASYLASVKKAPRVNTDSFHQYIGKPNAEVSGVE